MNIEWVEVLVDLLNTTPVLDGVATDVLVDDDSARSWLSAHEGDGADDLEAVREFRDKLQRVVRGDADADVLNTYLATVRKVPRVDAEGLQWSVEGPIDWRARVVLAWGQVQTDGPGRLRACANDDCQLFLLDRSRGGTGRWCSMSGCGNRMKARRHYRRTAGKSED